MTHRRFAPGLLLTAVALLAPGGVGAAGVATFRLTNTDSTGATPVKEVLARVLPPGVVVPRNVDADPPTILDPSTGYTSSGFDADALQVLIGEGTTSNGDPFQALKLDFGPGGFAPGGRLYFQLNRSPSYDGLVSLVLPTSVENLALEAIATPPSSVGGSGGNGGGGGAQVPEPASVLVWVAVAGAGAWRVRVHRRAGAAVA